MTLGGLPHSEIPGSKPACGSPRLIAACHVLRRLSAPRHPPCTLSSLTNLSTLLPANPIASNPIQLSMSSRSDPWDPREPRSRDENRAHRKARHRKEPAAVSQKAGGADRVRTDDLRLARAALSQLSYSPWYPLASLLRPGIGRPLVVGLGRLELPTSRLSGVRSNQLSYRPRCREIASVPWKLNRG